MILTGARVVTLDAANRVFDSGSVEIREDGSIGAVGRVARRGEAVDVGGRLVMPALINCHTHLYSTLARGMRLAGAAPKNFPEILKKVWWRLDRALDEEDVYYSALVGLIDSAKCGVGTLADHHSSPSACAGSLDVIERAFRKVGLRGALCYETSDRDASAHGLRENVRFLERAHKETIAGSFGLHASFTLSDRTLRACVEANQSLRAGFHVHVAEDKCDAGAARRLLDAGALDERALAVHSVHVTGAEMSALARRGVNVVHCPQSNANNAVGRARLPEMFRRGVMAGLGSDGYTPRMWDELRYACLGAGQEASATLLNNRAIAKKAWGFEIGRIETGARADLLVIDYYPPAPLAAENLFGHLLFGVANAPVDSLIVNGRYVVREGRCVNVDERRIAERAAKRAKALWERL